MLQKSLSSIKIKDSKYEYKEKLEKTGFSEKSDAYILTFIHTYTYKEYTAC